MTSQDFEHDVPVSAYGAARKAAWLAHLRANDEAMSAASMEAHQEDHATLTAGQQGIFRAFSPQEQAATVAASRRVGDGAGAGRDLVALGGTFDHGAVAPTPARADLRFANTPGYRSTGESPLAAYMRERS